VVFASHFRFVAGGLALAAVAIAGRTTLAQETATLSVSAQVAETCTLIGGSLDFGSYTGDAKEGEGSFSYECTSGANISLSLGSGSHSEGNGIRGMLSDGNLLQYRLFSDAGRQNVWGENGDAFLTQAQSSTQQTVPVYGLIDGGQDVPPGAYSDTALITLNIDGE
jgi:spore coat protein U-like protein